MHLDGPHSRRGIGWWVAVPKISQIFRSDLGCDPVVCTSDVGEPLPRRRLKQGTNSGYLLERIEGDYRAKISELELKAAPPSSNPLPPAEMMRLDRCRLQQVALSDPATAVPPQLAEAARDRAAAEVSYDQELTERDKEIESLRGQLDGELKQLLERQAKARQPTPGQTPSAFLLPAFW